MEELQCQLRRILHLFKRFVHEAIFQLRPRSNDVSLHVLTLYVRDTVSASEATSCTVKKQRSVLIGRRTVAKHCSVDVATAVDISMEDEMTRQVMYPLGMVVKVEIKEALVVM